jgi:hypothetical protein
MSRMFLDDNMLTWEVYPSGGAFEAAEHPFVVFNCLSNRMLRPRYLPGGEGAGDASRVIATASGAQLRELLKRSAEVA